MSSKYQLTGKIGWRNHDLFCWCSCLLLFEMVSKMSRADLLPNRFIRVERLSECRWLLSLNNGFSHGARGMNIQYVKDQDQ